MHIYAEYTQNVNFVSNLRFCWNIIWSNRVKISYIVSRHYDNRVKVKGVRGTLAQITHQRKFVLVYRTTFPTKNKPCT